MEEKKIIELLEWLDKRCEFSEHQKDYVHLMLTKAYKLGLESGQPSLPKEEPTCKFNGHVDSCNNETCWDLVECQRKPVSKPEPKTAEYKSTCQKCGSKNTAANSHNHLDKCLDCGCEYHDR